MNARIERMIHALAGGLLVLLLPLAGAADARPYQESEQTPADERADGVSADDASGDGAPADGGASPADVANGDAAKDGPPEDAPITLPSAAVGIAGLVERLGAEAPGEALELARRYEEVLEGLGASDAARWSDPDRALLDYVAALAAARVAESRFAEEEPDLERIDDLVGEAADRFQRAVTGAGPQRSDLRLRAAYAVGTLLLEAGERQVVRAQSTAMLAPQEVPYGPDTPERELLDEAARTFERSRTALIERLELDWRDADTRANLEWVQRRLAEIDAVRERADEEQERRDQEEQEQQQDDAEDDQEDDQEDDASEDGAEDDQSGDDESEDEESQDGEPESDDASQNPGDDGDPTDGDATDGESEEGESTDDTSDPDTGSDPTDDGTESTDAEQQEALEGENAEEGAEGDDGAEPTTVEGEPVEMTDVEVRRLLQRLAEIEAQGEATRRALAATQRRRVARDW